MRILEGANLALRFLLELSAIAAPAYWGFSATSGAARWALVVGAAAAVIAVWWLFVSPDPTIELARPVRFAIELGVWAPAGVRPRTARLLQWSAATSLRRRPPRSRRCGRT